MEGYSLYEGRYCRTLDAALYFDVSVTPRVQNCKDKCDSNPQCQMFRYGRTSNAADKARMCAIYYEVCSLQQFDHRNDGPRNFDIYIKKGNDN